MVEAATSIGVSVLFFSAILYSIAFLNVRECTDGGVNVMQLVMSRGIVCTIVASVLLIANGIPILPASKSGKQLALGQGVVSTLAMTGYFLSSALLPLGSASAIVGVYPIFTLVIASLWLKEVVNKVGVASMLACLSGLLLIVKTGTNDENEESAKEIYLVVFAYTIAIATAVCVSLSYVLIRMSGTGVYDPLQGLLSQGCSTVMFALFALRNSAALPSLPTSSGHSHVLPAWSSMLVCATIGLLCVLYGGRMCPAGLAAMISSTEIVWAYLWQIVVLHEPTDLPSLCGVLLIFASAMLLAFNELRYAASKVYASQDTGAAQDLTVNLIIED